MANLTDFVQFFRTHNYDGKVLSKTGEVIERKGIHVCNSLGVDSPCKNPYTGK